MSREEQEALAAKEGQWVVAVRGSRAFQGMYAAL